MFTVQRPLRWLFDALGIVQGGAPQELREQITPSIELMQGGWGQALYYSFAYVGAAGPSQFQPLADNGFSNAILVAKKYQFLLRLTYQNSDSINHTWSCVSFPASGAAFFVYLIHRTTANLGTDGWNELGFPAQWMHILPGQDVWINVPGFTTTPPIVQYELVALPAGARPI